MSTENLQRLIRQAAGESEIRAAFVGGPLAAGGDDPFMELDFWLVAPASFADRLREWPGLPADPAYFAMTADGCLVVTGDGVAVAIHVAPEVVAVPAGLQPVFNRTEYRPAGVGRPVAEQDLVRDAARFWHGLFQAAAAIGRGQAITAHGELEGCRMALLNLYRMALAPGEPPGGWSGAERIPGSDRVLDGLKEWLVAPLDLRAQWRCAHRLAAAYESLMLPLTERLGLAYPFAIRNLAFGRLDVVKRRLAEKGSSPEVVTPAPEPEPKAPGQGPAKFHIQRRGPV
ncbi:MAG TPA: hypothetical protein VGK74_21560 [Symbiobacteriaceae bacterium]|jgi:hypothetical protein